MVFLTGLSVVGLDLLAVNMGAIGFINWCYYSTLQSEIFFNSLSRINILLPLLSPQLFQEGLAFDALFFRNSLLG